MGDKIKQDIQAIKRAYMDRLYTDEIGAILKADMQQLYLDRNKDHVIGKIWQQMKLILSELKKDFSMNTYRDMCQLENQLDNYLNGKEISEMNTPVEIIHDMSVAKNENVFEKTPNPYIGVDESVVDNGDLRQMYKLICVLIQKHGNDTNVANLKVLLDKILKENAVPITTKVGD